MGPEQRKQLDCEAQGTRRAWCSRTPAGWRSGLLTQKTAEPPLLPSPLSSSCLPALQPHPLLFRDLRNNRSQPEPSTDGPTPAAPKCSSLNQQQQQGLQGQSQPPCPAAPSPAQLARQVPTPRLPARGPLEVPPALPYLRAFAPAVRLPARGQDHSHNLALREAGEPCSTRPPPEPPSQLAGPPLLVGLRATAPRSAVSPWCLSAHVISECLLI